MAGPRRAVLALGLPPGSAVDHVDGPVLASTLASEAALGRAGLDRFGWRPADADLPSGSLDELLAAAAGPIVLRDSLLCRLAAPWVAALARAGWTASALLVVRHPGAVAAELERTHGLTPGGAALFWLRATLDAELATRALPRVVVTHDRLLADGDAVAAQAGAVAKVVLGWTPGAGLPDAEPGLPDAGSAYAEVWCRHGWAALRTLAEAPAERHAEAVATLDRVRAQFDDACRLFDAARPAPAVRRRRVLQGVTLCAADSSRVALTARALRHSAGLCEFADTVLFTDVAVDGPGRVVSAGPIRSREDYSEFALRGLGRHVRTDHVLIVQWDGFVVDPAAWDDAFRRYDYIGARWGDFRDGMDVGNGGFSLRSRRLLDALGDPRLVRDPALLEDQQICRGWRRFLEREHGIAFAPPEVADRFAYERIWPGGPAFGFHGLFNLWRHLDDPALIAVAGLLPRDVLCGREFAELAVLCFVYDRPAAFEVLSRIWRDAAGDAAVAASVGRILKNPADAGRYLRAAGVT